VVCVSVCGCACLCLCLCVCQMSMCVCVCVPHVVQFIRMAKRAEGEDEEFRGAQQSRTNRHIIVINFMLNSGKVYRRTCQSRPCDKIGTVNLSPYFAISSASRTYQLIFTYLDCRKRTDYGVSNLWNLLQNSFDLIYLNMYVLVSSFNNVYWKTLTVFNTVSQTIMIKTLIKTTPSLSPCR